MATAIPCYCVGLERGKNSAEQVDPKYVHDDKSTQSYKLIIC